MIWHWLQQVGNGHKRSLDSTGGRERVLTLAGGHDMALASAGGHERSLDLTGGHERALASTGGHERALASTAGHEWQSFVPLKCQFINKRSQSSCLLHTHMPMVQIKKWQRGQSRKLSNMCDLKNNRKLYIV